MRVDPIPYDEIMSFEKWFSITTFEYIYIYKYIYIY